MSTSKPIITQEGVVLDADHFAKYADGPLLLKCFEVIDEAIDVVEEGAKIRLHDDTYFGFVEAYWALTALFKRHTGANAKDVSDKRIENLRAALFSGATPEPITLPSVKVERLARFEEPYFHQFSNLVLAAMAFNSTDEAYDELTHTRDQRLDDDTAWNLAAGISNANTALRVLVGRMSGGSLDNVRDIKSLISNPNGETVQ